MSLKLVDRPDREDSGQAVQCTADWRVESKMKTRGRENRGITEEICSSFIAEQDQLCNDFGDQLDGMGNCNSEKRYHIFPHPGHISDQLWATSHVRCRFEGGDWSSTAMETSRERVASTESSLSSIESKGSSMKTSDDDFFSRLCLFRSRWAPTRLLVFKVQVELSAMSEGLVASASAS